MKIITIVALFAASVSALSPPSNFHKYKSTLPADFDVVAAGGYYALEQMSVDPKSDLVSIIASGQNNNNVDNNDDKINVLVGLLQSRGKGFSADLIDGEWCSVMNIQSKKSPILQRFVGKLLRRKKKKKDKTKSSSSSKNSVQSNRSFANFDINKMVFHNLAYTPHGNGLLRATVAYQPTAGNYDKDIDDKIVLRRIGCDIIDVSFKYKKLPKIPIPLKKKGGYLDVLYLDEDMRITRGNRGGLFFHFRPAFATKVMNTNSDVDEEVSANSA